MESVGATVVLYPFPGMSHLAQFVEFAKLIHNHHPSLSIIIFIIPAPFEISSTHKYINAVSPTLPFISFHNFPTIPFPPDFYPDIKDRAFGIPELYNPILHNTLVSISQTSTIKAVFLDFFSNESYQTSVNLNIPTYFFWITGVSILYQFLYLITIHNKTISKKNDVENAYLDIPGVPRIATSDIDKLMLDQEHSSYKNLIKVASNMVNCSGIIVNGFVELERRAVDAFRDGKCVPADGRIPNVYLVGPLTANGNARVLYDPSENECLKWLDMQPIKSVVFLAFGSMGHVFKKDQLKEIAIGLEKSGQRFLWVVRYDIKELKSHGEDFNLDDVLPEGFLERIKDRGLVVKNWAPQPAILSHYSVGGFVSHCGWNSILEAVVAAVPILAWPLYAEQKMNRAYLVQELKVALAMKMSENGFVIAEEVEQKVKELLENRVVREKVSEISKTAQVLVDNGGSSRVDFFKLTRSWET
ncbi:UDP-glycosyltransferase 88B1-like [Rutidosis leptorrhynchoides]|uniref:UDP-glycosyltransferase 88B1-like n=1 Tax=Rutidosis leptorrhynchoides TaxID=125765 RepID=UPI003A9A5D2F